MPDSALKEAATRASTYLNKLRDRRVAPLDENILRLQELKSAFPDRSASARTASAGGRCFGFVTGGTLPQALAASWLVSAWDQNASLTVMSPAASFFEELALNWVKEVFRLPPDCAG